MFAVGTKVRTRFALDGRKRRGVVEKRDGGYVFVRLNGKRGAFLFELYDCELETFH